MSHLFIYWKIPSAHAQAALDAVRQAQAALRAAHPGLKAELFRRRDAAAATESIVTGMETYAMAGGIDEHLQWQLVTAGNETLRPFGAPHRQVEAFEELPR